MSIVAEKLNYVYNPNSPFETAALKDVTLTVEEGDFFGVIGHTGSGKSTLVQHFNALIRLSSGKLTVEGIDLAQKKIDFKALRAGVGMVFQYPEYQLFGETVERDVAFGLINFYGRKTGSKKDAPTALSDLEIAERVQEAIELVGLDYESIRNRSPFELSGGQKRRVAIAGIIVTRPKVLILDEPTAGLDPAGKEEILKLIHSLKEKCTPTIVMVGHDMDEIAENCTRVAVFNEGKVEFVLPPEELFAKADQLAALGLDVPTVAKIKRALSDFGLDVPMSFSANSFAKALAVAMKEVRK